ncbi:MAG: cobalt ABC transporter permease [Deltaproteobacteria bacterium]
MRQVKVIVVLLLLTTWFEGFLDAAEKWQGIDETVVQKIAGEHGRKASKPLINIGEGDLQLFVFLVAGAAGGFVAGYCWRALLDGKKKVDSDITKD